ncbi:RING finger protein 11 [Fasciola gigantica]|uniref:RING finger protein 11 n=1 Tax=Fasciola gigantica TaxID=46835 RepID=A0A504YSJ2_FASGI|nr:RING finger protein 11 [Fasciola gigantica]
MGNCFGFFSTSGQLLDNEEEDDSIAEDRNTQQSQVPVYHLHPGLSVPASRLTEEEQMQIVKRIDMIQFLPFTNYVPTNTDKLKECIICMCDLKLHDEVRYLPCLHTYHRACIDDWLMRSFVCPSCLRPVEVDFIAATASATDPDTNDRGSPPVRVSSHPETRTTTGTEAVPTSPSSSSLSDPKQQPAEQSDALPRSPHTLLSQSGLVGLGPDSVPDH